MTRNGTVSQLPAPSELAELVALAYPDPMPLPEKPQRAKPARFPRKRPALSAERAQQERQAASDQALRRALRVSAPMEHWETLPTALLSASRESRPQVRLETKPMRLVSLYQAWLRLAKWAKSNLRHPSGLPGWKRRYLSETSPLASSPSSSSVRIRTKVTKSAAKSGKTSKKRGKDARKN